jgi:hypothetical protein
MEKRTKRKGRLEHVGSIAQRVLAQAAEQMELRKGEHSGPPGFVDRAANGQPKVGSKLSDTFRSGCEGSVVELGRNLPDSEITALADDFDAIHVANRVFEV